MMQVTTPSIVTAQHGTNNPPFVFRNETEIRVASQKHGNGAVRVGLVQPHALGASSQSDDRTEIFDSEMAHDRSIGATATIGLLIHSRLTD
jgi:hypothetical protein